MVGALIVLPVLFSTQCISRHRARGWLTPWGSTRCQQILSFDEPLAKTLDANGVVFAAHAPPPDAEMSPWFQFMLAVLRFDIALKMINQIEGGDVLVTIDAGLAYGDDLTSEWTTKSHLAEGSENAL